MKSDQQMTMDSLCAPKLWLRRNAAIYVLPWSLVIYAFLIYWYGWAIGVPARFLGSYWILIFLLCVLIDLAAPQSRLVRLACIFQRILKKLFPSFTFSNNRVTDDQLLVFFTCRKPPLFRHRQLRSLAMLLTFRSHYLGIRLAIHIR